MERLKTEAKVAGLKQCKKAALAGRAALVFAAEDADPRLLEPLRRLCAREGIPVEPAPSMKALAKACRVEVPTACAALLRCE